MFGVFFSEGWNTFIHDPKMFGFIFAFQPFGNDSSETCDPLDYVPYALFFNHLKWRTLSGHIHTLKGTYP